MWIRRIKNYSITQNCLEVDISPDLGNGFHICLIFD